MASKDMRPTNPKCSPESIPATGLSVIYEPDTDYPIADIIMVHGLKGHPYKTWRYTPSSKTADKQPPPTRQSAKSQPSKRLQLRRSIMSWKKEPSTKGSNDSEPTLSVVGTVLGPTAPNEYIFWPVDLLPEVCENARILTFGYDTKVTKYTSGPTNMNSILSHGKDLLFSLGRQVVPGRPLIFIAHSLGGILVKEMLALSSTSETSAQGVVEWTKAIIFLGTPHRGSPEFSKIGERARSILSSLRFQTAAAILDTLRQGNTDLQRAHESFTRLWQRYNFRVKTFQEGFGLTGINIWVLGSKVVPHDSSLIGDPREHSETLQANHMEMCRFSSASDPNYLKVAGEINDIYMAISKSAQENRTLEDQAEPQKMVDILLHKLHFDRMDRRKNLISLPMLNTGRWLSANSTYREWRLDHHVSHPILLIKGKPGAGKSTLMKEAVQHTQSVWKGDSLCASFFVDGTGHDMEHSTDGVFRSLLFQLLPHTKVSTSDPSSTEARSLKQAIQEAAWSSEELSLPELQTLLIRTLEALVLNHTPIYIFVDALDELQEEGQRKQIDFWSDMVHSSKLQKLRVCLSCRHFPVVTVADTLELVLENHNSKDIAYYIQQRLRSRMNVRDTTWRDEILQKIQSRSAGVFLWVVLVVDRILAKYDYGFNLRNLLRAIEDTPTGLRELYIEILCSLGVYEKQVALGIFQWIIAAARPLRLDEWYHVLAFVKYPMPTSLRGWRRSDTYTENDKQLEREIRSLSRGLLEVSNSQCSDTNDASSVDAGAGSLDQEHGSARIIRLTHPSVYDFFVHHSGFECLGYYGQNPVEDCHVTIASTCLAYINVPELDEFILARQRVEVATLTTLSLYSVISEQSLHSSHSQRNTDFGKNLKMLHTMLPTDPCQLVKSWLKDRGLPACPNYNLDESDSSISSAPEMLQRPRIDEYPALLLYIVNELNFHLQIAKKSTNADRTFATFEKSKTRWDALQLGQRTEFSNIDAYNKSSALLPLVPSA
ncbi:Ff.00g053950.m01.CDS01 [Fusarium sp. VM40]|nr:Ff.00g053950.m01.CDS01 [Fusarium sp. VM40]